MYEFLQTFEKKSAFKKALKEIVHEKPEPIVLSEKKTSDVSVKVGQNPRPYSYAISNPLRKPETTAIDLKNFKDWRHIDSVKSDSPRPRSVVKPVIEEDEEPSLVFPGTEEKTFAKPVPSSVNSVDVMEKFAVIPRDETKDTDIKSYLTGNADEKVEPVRKKITLQQLIDRFKTDQDAGVLAEEPVENKIKVEVVDLSEKKPEPVKKPPVKRRPRGKSKRKFDADVISSVDWK